jgi:hypothetical protein
VDAAAIDRTPKLYIGGKQVRPDGGYSREVWAGAKGRPKLLGVVPEGNRKDIRNAVEAARAAAGWERQSAHGRAQVLYYLAENLAAQRRAWSNCWPPCRRRGRARRAAGQRRLPALPPPPGPTSSTAPCTSRRCAA